MRKMFISVLSLCMPAMAARMYMADDVPSAVTVTTDPATVPATVTSETLVQRIEAALSADVAWIKAAFHDLVAFAEKAIDQDVSDGDDSQEETAALHEPADAPADALAPTAPVVDSSGAAVPVAQVTLAPPAAS